MSSWTCLTCGTHNDDVLDKPRLDIFSNREATEMELKIIDKEMDRRMEIENRGEIPPMYCSRCSEKRA